MDTPRWLSDEQQRAWRKLAAVLTVLPAKLDAQLQRDAGLTQFGYWVLAMLSEDPSHALRMSELAARSNASPSRVSHVVARLEQRGWVSRTKSSSDARGNIARLTEAGLRKVVESAPGHVETVQDLVFDGLSPGQVRNLNELCTVLLKQIDPEGNLRALPPES